MNHAGRQQATTYLWGCATGIALANVIFAIRYFW